MLQKRGSVGVATLAGCSLENMPDIFSSPRVHRRSWGAVCRESESPFEEFFTVIFSTKNFSDTRLSRPDPLSFWLLDSSECASKAGCSLRPLANLMSYIHEIYDSSHYGYTMPARIHRFVL